MALSNSALKRHLFGGAMSLQLPENWLSAVDLTSVPDNQECFVLRAGAGCTGGPRSPLSLVVEVLERAEDAGFDPRGCAAYFLRDLAEHDGASPRDAEAAVAGGSRAVDLAREMPQLGLEAGGASAGGGAGGQSQARAREMLRRYEALAAKSAEGPDLDAEVALQADLLRSALYP